MSGAIFELLRVCAKALCAREPKRPAIIGVGGAQGSGKTYQCRYFAKHGGFNVAHFSLDDVYLTLAEREHLAKTVHPLFITRGPPGTHDLDLARTLIGQLQNASEKQETLIPKFDKAKDDRAPQSEWTIFQGRPDLILVDGWCIPAAAPVGMPIEPINPVEEIDDPHRIWRNHMLTPLATRYPIFFRLFDATIYLRAPNFDVVRDWRTEQEKELLGRQLTGLEHATLDRFIQHYERVTRAMLAGAHRADLTVHLDESRNVVSIEERQP